jgi:hypothetical protein
MNKTFLVILASLVVAACEKKSESSVASIESSIEEKYIEKAKVAVVKDFKDPSSAQFRNVREKGGEVCGEVNAKNAMGGYVGFQRFWWVNYAPDRASILSDTSTLCQ